MNKLTPSILDRLQFAFLRIRDVLLFLITRNFDVFIRIFTRMTPRYLDWTSRVRARRAYYNALNTVPAYRRFIECADDIANWRDILPTDKKNYVNTYSFDKRCVGGKVPLVHATIDESSGSTGQPHNWVRGTREKLESHANISFFAHYCYGKNKPWITINAFSMGAWATGFNMGIALQKNSIVKNTGPELDKIFHTMKVFGAEHPYLITGYPPFLKQMIDVAHQQGFPLADYSLTALVGGEGMSEGLRDYLQPYFRKVYSGYGATDVEIGIAGETPASVAIRRLAAKNEKVRRTLFGDDSRLPMVFQYNPVMHFIEATDEGELLFTVTRLSLLSPRIRYNIHDEGGVLRYDEMQEKLRVAGVDVDSLTPSGNSTLSLPFLWVFGRKDFTISIMGANIYPEDLEQCIYADPELSRITKSFCQGIHEDKNANVRPAFYIEIIGEFDDALRDRYAECIIQNLVKINADFREAWSEYADTLRPIVTLHREGEGPFARDKGKIKQARLAN